MRTIHNDLQYIELLKSFQEAHKKLAMFYMDDSEGDYTHISPNFYPFEQSFDDYLKGIQDWLTAQYKAIGIEDQRHTHIEEVFTENTGGGCMVDFIHLMDGYRIGISDECIVLYVPEEDEKGDERDELGHISHYEHGGMYDLSEGEFSHIEKHETASVDGIVYYDIVTLKNGIVFTIDDAQISVFTDFTEETLVGTIKRP